LISGIGAGFIPEILNRQIYEGKLIVAVLPSFGERYGGLTL